MNKEKERDEVLDRTEKNRQELPASVLNSLDAMSISLADVLNMSRQEFDVLNRKLYEQKMSDDDRGYLITFKHDSMTHDERLAYIEPTDAEWDEIEKSEEADYL